MCRIRGEILWMCGFQRPADLCDPCNLSPVAPGGWHFGPLLAYLIYLNWLPWKPAQTSTGLPRGWIRALLVPFTLVPPSFRAFKCSLISLSIYSVDRHRLPQDTSLRYITVPHCSPCFYFGDLTCPYIPRTMFQDVPTAGTSGSGGLNWWAGLKRHVDLVSTTTPIF